MKTINFRGLLADTEIQTIRLSTNNGMIGYRIKKLELVGKTPGAQDSEAVVQVDTIKPTAASATIDFNSPTLLAVGVYTTNSASFNYPTTLFTIFDNVKFNQDIYVSNQCLQGSAINYYLELEQVKLDLNEATVATLKDMRGRE